MYLTQITGGEGVRTAPTRIACARAQHLKVFRGRLASILGGRLQTSADKCTLRLYVGLSAEEFKVLNAQSEQADPVGRQKGQTARSLSRWPWALSPGQRFWHKVLALPIHARRRGPQDGPRGTPHSTSRTRSTARSRCSPRPPRRDRSNRCAKSPSRHCQAGVRESHHVSGMCRKLC